tara:strand:+ start:632 stop:787 length:156 start_codon:yes stop_codon:yes gene_type:complete
MEDGIKVIVWGAGCYVAWQMAEDASPLGRAVCSIFSWAYVVVKALIDGLTA